MSAAAATRKLGFWTNFGIMAREAPPRPITPTPKTRSLAIYSSYEIVSQSDVRPSRASGRTGKCPIPFVVRLSNHERNCDTVSIAGRPPGTLVFSMTIQARRNCPDLPELPARATGILLLRAGLVI